MRVSARWWESVRDGARWSEAVLGGGAREVVRGVMAPSVASCLVNPLHIATAVAVRNMLSIVRWGAQIRGSNGLRYLVLVYPFLNTKGHCQLGND